MLARFIGDPRHRDPLPPVFVAFGLTFPAGEFVEVPAAHAAKIAANSHFEVKDEAPAPGPDLPVKRPVGRPRKVQP